MGTHPSSCEPVGEEGEGGETSGSRTAACVSVGDRSSSLAWVLHDDSLAWVLRDDSLSEAVVSWGRRRDRRVGRGLSGSGDSRGEDEVSDEVSEGVAAVERIRGGPLTESSARTSSPGA